MGYAKDSNRQKYWVSPEYEREQKEIDSDLRFGLIVWGIGILFMIVSSIFHWRPF